MGKDVKRRSYDNSRRQEMAIARRHDILVAARDLFIEQGYARTTMSQIATRANVAVDTIYASVGTKPAMFRLLIETAISGTDEPVEALSRGYVQAMRAEPDAGRKLEIYAHAIRTLQGRLAPLVRVLQEAAHAHAELAELWHEIGERRARNMRLLAADLQATGQVRADLATADIADIVWATNSSEFYALLVLERGWTPARFEAWLSDSWKRLLLDEPARR